MKAEKFLKGLLKLKTVKQNKRVGYISHFEHQCYSLST